MTARPHASNSFLLEGRKCPVPPLDPGLYVTSTPIGHLADVTLRALQVLAAADLILCEDTRVSRKLLQKYGIETPLRAYHDHNAESVRPGILNKLGAGAAIALVSDAGTPLVSDPGFKLVRAALEHEIPVTSVPGASAPLAALAIAGLPSDRFLFAGFPPAKKGQRETFFKSFAGLNATLVFFASTRKLGAVLAEIQSVLGDRPAVIARELTKLHEEVLRGDVSDLQIQLAARPPLKGEVTLLVAGAQEQEHPDGDSLDRMIEQALQTDSVRDVASTLAEALNLPRRQIYLRALELSKSGTHET